MMHGLNRTSVGLKQVSRVMAMISLLRLNRTSVGLKLQMSVMGMAKEAIASIEPAWD